MFSSLLDAAQKVVRALFSTYPPLCKFPPGTVECMDGTCNLSIDQCSNVTLKGVKDPDGNILAFVYDDDCYKALVELGKCEPVSYLDLSTLTILLGMGGIAELIIFGRRG